MKSHGVMLGTAQYRISLMGTLTDNKSILPVADPLQADLPRLQLFLLKMLQDEMKLRVKASPEGWAGSASMASEDLRVHTLVPGSL